MLRGMAPNKKTNKITQQMKNQEKEISFLLHKHKWLLSLSSMILKKKIPLNGLKSYQRNKKSQQRKRNNKKLLTDSAKEHQSLGEKTTGYSHSLKVIISQIT